MNIRKIKLQEMPKEDMKDGILVQYETALVGQTNFISSDIKKDVQEYDLPNVKILAIYYRIK